jgi:hypothetical protein
MWFLMEQQIYFYMQTMAGIWAKMIIRHETIHLCSKLALPALRFDKGS